MRTLLFIPALLEGDVHGFMVKLSVMLFSFLFVIVAVNLDLISGIAASKRTGTKRTTSWGLRRTLTKLLEYFAVFIVMLLLDMGLSVFSQFLSIFSVPLLSGLAVIVECVTEGISVLENTRRGRDKDEDKIDDLTQLAQATVDAVGKDNLKNYLEALNKYVEQKKA